MIRVIFPEVMKMQVTAHVRITPQTTSLSRLKKEVFTQFWETFTSMKKHGSPEHVSLTYRDFSLKTDAALQKAVTDFFKEKNPPAFESVFKVSHS